MALSYRFACEKEFDALLVDVQLAEPKCKDLSSMKYPAKLHARRVAKELGVEDGLIYIAGQPDEHFEDSDQLRPFRQRRYFFYIAGANFANCHVTYEIAKDLLRLWIPFTDAQDVLWHGFTPTIDDCKQHYDVDDVCYTFHLDRFLQEWRKLNVELPAFVLDAGQWAELLQRSALPGVTDGMNERILDDALRPAMDRARVIKTDYEIAMCRRANIVSSAAHRTVAEHLRGLSSERDVEAIFRAVCTSRGARDQAYPIIAGAGANASTLHYGTNDQTLEHKELLLIDAGCEWNGYASDITRTMPINGKFSPEAAAIYTIVQRMQEKCIECVQPGVLYHHLHLQATEIAADGLLELGILVGSLDDVVRKGVIALFFPHGLSHHVGLEVHDVTGGLPLVSAHYADVRYNGRKREMISPAMLEAIIYEELYEKMLEEQGQASIYAKNRETQALKPNMIVTVEPGIYFCRQYLEAKLQEDSSLKHFINMKVLERYYPVGGVRIEDCILVTPQGYENLTNAPKGEELLHIINGDEPKDVLDTQGKTKSEEGK